MGWGLAAMAVASYLASKKAEKGGGESPLPTYYMEYLSPEQKKLAEMLWPQMSKIMGGEGYQIPDIGKMMPGKGWYEEISPELKAAAWEPYEESARRLREMMGTSLGSARGGMSGAAADVMANYMADVTPTVASNLWQMVSPAYTAGWQAELEKAQLPAQTTLGMLPSTFSDLMVGHHPTFQEVNPTIYEPLKRPTPPVNPYVGTPFEKSLAWRYGG